MVRGLDLTPVRLSPLANLTATVFMNTQVATATAALSWILVEDSRRPTTLGSRRHTSQVRLRLRPQCGLSPQWVFLVRRFAGRRDLFVSSGA